MKSSWMFSAALSTAFVLTAGAAQAAPGSASLFSPLDPDRSLRRAPSLDASFHALADDPATASMQVVQAHPNAIRRNVQALTLNLGLGLDLQARRTDSYVNASGSLVWAGVITEPGSALDPAEQLAFDPANSVVLVRNGDKVTGNVRYGAELYKIRPLRTGGHAIVAVDSNAMPPDHPAEYGQIPVVRMPQNSVSGATARKAISNIRVMVHYTSSAAAASGDINGLIDLAVAETNQGYANSGVEITMTLAHKSQVTYTQSGSFSTDLSRYRGTSDGYMDSIHTTRNSVAADVGVLVINNSSSCGLASGIGSTASTAFANAHWDCITGYYSFGHEVGHLLSARHDPATDPTNSPYAYGHGYQYNGSPKWRTIMAYACSGGCPRLNYWSNPNKLYNGQPMGTTNRSDNARVLNNTKATVAAFR